MAAIPMVSQSSVEVEFAFVEPKVVGVNGNELPAPHDVADTEPEELTVRHWPDEAPSEEIVSAVVEARPVLEMEKSVEVADWVDEPIAKSVLLVSPLFAWMERRAKGEVVPMPN